MTFKKIDSSSEETEAPWRQKMSVSSRLLRNVGTFFLLIQYWLLEIPKKTTVLIENDLNETFSAKHLHSEIIYFCSEKSLELFVQFNCYCCYVD